MSSPGTQTQTSTNIEPEDEQYLINPVQGFDLRTHVINPKSGKLLRRQPYRYVVDKDHGNYFIRDGKLFSEQGKLLSGESLKAEPMKVEKK